MTDELIADLVAGAANMALLFVGVPHQEMLVALFSIRKTIREQLSAMLGAEVATLVSEALVATVIRRRSEIESSPN
jgi:hypothetical protein